MQIRTSFEYSPFRSEAEYEKLQNTAIRLQAFKPEYHSVTFGAGGSTKRGTAETVERLRNQGHNAIPHISWGSSSKAEIFSMVKNYCNSGVKEMVVLRGDLPSGYGSKANLPPAEKLVELLRTRYSSDDVFIRVGCYPEVHPDAKSAKADLESLKRKLDAGADESVTQYFYNVDAFEDFANRYTQIGIQQPLVPGIMPITNYETIVRFSAKCGAEVPRWLQYRLDGFKGDAAALRSYGVEVVSQICERLIGIGVPALHFYTLNGYVASSRILKNLSY